MMRMVTSVSLVLAYLLLHIQTAAANGIGGWPLLRWGMTPEVLEPRRRQLGVTHSMLDRANCSRVVAGIRQGVTATMTQHVHMHQEIKTGALTDALDQAIDSIRRERSLPLFRALISELVLRIGRLPRLQHRPL